MLKLSDYILAISRNSKITIAVVVDVCCCILAMWLSFYLRLGEIIALSDASFLVIFISIFLALPIFFLFGLYKVIFRHSGWPSLGLIGLAIIVYGLLFSSIVTAIGISDVPRTVGVIQPILLFLLVGASRVFAWTWLGGNFEYFVNKKSKSKVLIYGAGSSGRQISNALNNSEEMKVVGFLDDDRTLQGHVLNAVRIYSPSELETVSRALSVDYILLAMPKISRNRRNKVLSKINQANLSVRTIPSLSDLAKGKVTVDEILDLDIDDLLGREAVSANQILLSKNINNKTVLVTGAGGSIGSELCRQIAELRPKRILLIEQSEYALYRIHQDLQARTPGIPLIPLLSSVQDRDRIKEILSRWRPQTIYHAAAYKHVPLVEHNIVEGIKNNVFGTLTMAEESISADVKNLVLISTDKAVRPTSVMGASKRLAEMLLQALAGKNRRPKFSIVRFGNVLGSSGSVVPKFRQQIKNGGPVTITDPEVTRFFMTLSEAAQLTIQAGAMAKSGDVFVLDMGKPVKIIELARRMIELSGLKLKDGKNSDGDIEFKITGLRPGEKLYEELLIGNSPESTAHPRIIRAMEKFIDWSELENQCHVLDKALNAGDIDEIINILKRLVDNYNAHDGVVDWLYEKKSLLKT